MRSAQAQRGGCIQALESLRSDAHVGTLSMASLELSFLICERGDSCLLYRVDVQVTRDSTSRAPRVVPGHVKFISRAKHGCPRGKRDWESKLWKVGRGVSKRGQGQVAPQIHCFPAEPRDKDTWGKEWMVFAFIFYKLLPKRSSFGYYATNYASPGLRLPRKRF